MAHPLDRLAQQKLDLLNAAQNQLVAAAGLIQSDHIGEAIAIIAQAQRDLVLASDLGHILNTGSQMKGLD